VARNTPRGYACAMERTEPGYVTDREAILKRLSRIEGQVRGVKGMVEDDAYCIDVLTQIGAITKALDGVGLRLLSDHTDHCVRDAIAQGGSDADEKVDELLAAVERFARTR
jgi:CsoR family transcriptional regulator, copper-sensing transcriptional repressor